MNTKKAVTNAEVERSKMADRIWTSEGEHVVLWDEVQVIEKEHSWKERKLKEAAHIAMSVECLSQSSAELTPMWLPLLNK